jgi:hypothetical protein
MEAVLPFDQMSVAEKFRAMEAIWNDLRPHDNEVDSPAWHGEVLAARQVRLDRAESSVSDWSEAKQRIRDRVRRDDQSDHRRGGVNLEEG